MKNSLKISQREIECLQEVAKLANSKVSTLTSERRRKIRTGAKAIRKLVTWMTKLHETE